jgi:hypothetical protein
VESDDIGSFTGKVYRNYDGQCIGCDYIAPLEIESEQSPLTITFNDSQQGILDWFGESIPISRFFWSWADAADQLTVMGRFVLADAKAELQFQVDLFGKQSTEQLLKITATRKSDNQEHIFKLTPVASAGILFADRSFDDV